MCDLERACTHLEPIHLSLVQRGGPVHFKGPDQFLDCEGQDHGKDELDHKHVIGLREAELCGSGNIVLSILTLAGSCPVLN